MDTKLLQATVKRYQIDSMSAADDDHWNYDSYNIHVHTPLVKVAIRKSGLDLLMQDTARALCEQQAAQARAACPALQKAWDEYQLLLALTAPHIKKPETSSNTHRYKGLYDKLSSN